MSDIVPEDRLSPSELTQPFADQFNPNKYLEGLQISRLIELPPKEQDLLTYFYDNVIFARLAKGLQVEVTVKQPLHGYTEKELQHIYEITDKDGMALEDEKGNRT